MSPFIAGRLMQVASDYYRAHKVAGDYDKLAGMRYLKAFFADQGITLSQRQTKWAMEYAYTMMES